MMYQRLFGSALIAISAVALGTIARTVGASTDRSGQPRQATASTMQARGVVAQARAWNAAHGGPQRVPYMPKRLPAPHHLARRDAVPPVTIWPKMTTVTQRQLVSGGVVLSAPATQSPLVSASAADSAAQAFVAPREQWIMRENVLADYTGGVPPGTVNRLVYVVSMLPPGGVSALPQFDGGHGAPDASSASSQSLPTPEYMIVLVDSTTGEPILSLDGN